MVAGLLSVQVLAASYLDAKGGTGGNTFQASNDSLTTWWTTAGAADNLWRFRTNFAFNPSHQLGKTTANTVYDSGGSNAENSPAIYTIVSGLTVGKWYDVDVVYWSTNSSGLENWTVKVGFNLDNMLTYDRLGTVGIAGTPTGTFEDNRIELLGRVGQIQADVNGQFRVYVDDLPPGSNYNRTWYDGVLYALTTVPYALSDSQAADVADVDVTLSWNAAQDTVGSNPVNPNLIKQYVYITKDQVANPGDPNLFYLGQATLNLSNPASSYVTNLAYDASYDWAVVDVVAGNDYTPVAGVSLLTAVDPNNLVSAVASFDTLSSSPSVVTQPQDILLPASALGTSVNAFSISVSSVSTAHYQWYKSTDNANNTPVDTAVGTDSATLTINPLALTDIGFYYCKVTNDGGNVLSNVAILSIERLAGQWLLNNNLTDASGNGWTGSIADPNFNADSLEGTHSYEFFGVGDGRSIEITGSEDPYSFFRLGLTVSCWVKSTNTGWGGLMCKQNRDIPTWTGYTLDTNGSGRIEWNMRSIGGVTGNTVVTDGQWHLVTGTYDGDTGKIVVYVDGEEEKAATYSATPLLSDKPLLLGAEKADGSTPYKGLMDDVRVYTYARTPQGVLDLYNEFTTPDKILCLDPYYAAADISGPAGVPDCKVNMYDFAVIATGWLDCGLYPTCN